MQSTILHKRHLQFIGVALAASLALRFALLPQAHITELDTSLRIFTALGWWQNLDWPAYDAWLPLHRMLLGSWMAFGSIWSTSRVELALAFGILSHAALVVAVAYTSRVLTPKHWFLPLIAVVFGNLYLFQSFNPLAEMPAVVLLVLAIGLLVDADRRAAPALLLVALLAMLGAQMLRYETWLLCFGLSLLPSRRPWRVLILLMMALFPLLWLGGHYAIYGDPLHGLHTAFRWQLEQGIKPVADLRELVRRMTFFAGTLAAGSLLPMALLAVLGLGPALRQRQMRVLAALVILTLMMDLWALVSGRAIMHSRYLLLPATLLLFMAPLGWQLVQTHVFASAPRLWRRGIEIVLLFALLLSPTLYQHASGDTWFPRAQPFVLEDSARLSRDIDSNASVVFYNVESAQAYALALAIPGDIVMRVHFVEPQTFGTCALVQLAQTSPQAFVVANAKFQYTHLLQGLTGLMHFESTIHSPLRGGQQLIELKNMKVFESTKKRCQ